MWNFDQILACTDLSSVSQRAVDAAVCLADTTRTPLQLMYVSETARALGLYPSFAQAEGPARNGPLQEQLARLRETLPLDRGLIKETMLLAPHAGIGIVEGAEDGDTHLIVMGTRGYRGLRRLFLGSVASEVVRSSPYEVLIVPMATTVDRIPPTRIVAAVDFSERSRKVVERVATLCEIFGAQAHVAHVIRSSDAETTSDDQIEEALGRVVDSIALRATFQYHVLRGRPVVELSELLRRVRADLVVLGSRGGGGLEAAVLGSTCQQMLSLSPCPVWSIPNAKSPAMRPARIVELSPAL